MGGTRRLLRFRGTTSHECVVPRLLMIGVSTRTLAHRTAALRDATTAVGHLGRPRQRHPVVPTDNRSAMVKGGGMLDRITIAGNGIWTLHALLANAGCDMLAMALFLEKYTRSIGSADRDKIEMAWLLRWKENLGNSSRLPRKVMRAYLEFMDISAETLDDQMDWECWPVDDAVEEFEFDTASDSSPSL